MNFKKTWKRFFCLSRHNDGFTLVELIVVIAILAILAGVAVPAYNGYIEKANESHDIQLLADINTAFAAACMNNGEDPYNLSGTPGATVENKVFKGVTYSADQDIEKDFELFYDLGESEFKTYAALYFNGEEGVFKAVSSALTNLMGIFSEGDINSFNASIFASLGLDSLMGQVDMATQLALAADPNSTLGKMVFDDANMANLANYLGYDLSKEEDSEKFAAAFQALAAERVDKLVAAGADPTDVDALYGQATNEILANTAVLVAATNSNFDTNAFKTQLAAGKGKDTIKSSMDGETGNQTALAQTALAYAMYTSYTAQNGGTPTNDIYEVLDTLESKEFMTYMGTNQATADLNGYLSAMNMINSASGDKDAVSHLLVNGFGDAELIAMLNQEING